MIIILLVPVMFVKFVTLTRSEALHRRVEKLLGVSQQMKVWHKILSHTSLPLRTEYGVSSTRGGEIKNRQRAFSKYSWPKYHSPET